MGAEAGEIIAACYDLGAPLGEPRYADRGELGRIWRLDTDRGSWAVKESDVPVSEAGAAADVAFQRAAAALGVPLPLPVLTRDGNVVVPAASASLASASLRVYEWVDLLPGAVVDASVIGEIAARLHTVEHPPAGPVEAWFAEPLGDGAWRRLLANALAADASWAPALARSLAELIEADAIVEPPDPVGVATCHRDLNRENVRPASDGAVVVIDWENSGSLPPERELAMILADIAADLSDDAAAAAYESYQSVGGPARLRGTADFSAALAVQGHLLRFYGERALDGSAAEADRARAERRLHSMLHRPLTGTRVVDLLGLLPG